MIKRQEKKDLTRIFFRTRWKMRRFSFILMIVADFTALRSIGVGFVAA
ncbi:MAG: hypothetical protein IKI88_06505 [Anaerotignum sp.]|nr:hypothetical protein [Anaerotignum sp.]